MSRGRSGFDIDVRRQAATAHIVLTGELDLESVSRVERTLQPLQLDGVGRLVLDLRGLRFIDSSGLNLLLELDAASRDGGPELVVVHGAPHVRRVFELTGLADHFATVDPATLDGGANRAGDGAR